MKQLLRLIVVLGLLASIISIFPLSKGIADTASNVPITCSCENWYNCKCITLSNVAKSTGNTETDGYVNAVTKKVKSHGTLKVFPDANGKIRLELYMPKLSPENCNTSEPDIEVDIGETLGVQEDTTARITTTTSVTRFYDIKARDYTFPAEMVVHIKDKPQDVCARFTLVLGCSCESCEATACPKAGVSTGTPDGGRAKPDDSCGGTGSYIPYSSSSSSSPAGDEPTFPGPWITIPVGVSEFGDIHAEIAGTIDTLPYTGRSMLRALAPKDVPITADSIGLLGVTTDSMNTTLSDALVSGRVVTTITIKDATNTSTIRTVTLKSTSDTNLILTTVYNGHTEEKVWTRSTSTSSTGSSVTWTFTEGNGKSKVVNTKTVNTAGTVLVERVATSEEIPASATSAAATVPISDMEITSALKGWGWEINKEVVDPDGAALITTYSYHDSGDGTSRVKLITRPDGSSESHTYVHTGASLTDVTTSPFTSGGTTTTPLILERTKTLTSQTEKVGSKVLSKVDISNTSASTTTTKTYFGSGISDFTASIVEYNSQNKPVLVTHPDGTQTTYAYSVTAGEREVTTSTGPASGTEGTETYTRTNKQGQMLESKTTLFTGTGTSRVATVTDHWKADPTLVDVLGRPTKLLYFPDGGPAWTTLTAYGCCGVESETDRYGILTEYIYDDLQRRTSSKRYAGTPITTTMSYNLPAGTGKFADTTSRNGNIIAKSVRNLAGTYTESWGPSAFDGTLQMLSSTTTTYRNGGTSLPAGIGTRTITTPIFVLDTLDSPFSNQTEERFLDGRVSTVTGALSPEIQYDYEVTDTGLATTRSYIDGSDLREPETIQTDWAGRTAFIQTLNEAGTPVFTYHLYNSLGQLVSVTDPDGVETLYGYNARGERTTTALDIAGTTAHTIDFNGKDQITTTVNTPGSYGGYSVLTTVTQVYAADDDATATTVSTTHQTPDGLHSWSITPGYSTDSSAVVSAVTASETVLSTTAGNWKEITTHPDGTRTVSNYTSGLLTSVEQRDATTAPGALIASTTYTYDSLNRPETITDLRTGTGGVTTNVYISSISDALYSVTTPDGTTTYEYNDRGNLVYTELPDSSSIDTQYYQNGLVAVHQGSQTYPTLKEYDYANRLHVLHTSPELHDGDGALTTWNYSDKSGRLTSKIDDAGNGPTYTYTDAGRLKSRKWDRGKFTQYAYFKGRQVATQHFTDNTATASDSDTPDVATIYNRTGQPQRMITSAIGGKPGTSIEYTFGAPGLNVTKETSTIDPDLSFSAASGVITVDEGSVSTPTIQRVLHRKTDDLLRNLGADLRLPDTTLVVGQTLAYHADSGRLDTVTGNLNSTDRTFTYGYQGSSHGLIASVAGPVHTVTNTWKTDQDVLDKKENKVGSTNIASYQYSVNSIGQRTAVDASGSAFGTEADWNWSYNDHGELVSAQHTHTSASSRHYDFDSIGNRTEHREGTHTTTGGTATVVYTPDSVNQYAAIDNLAAAPVYDTDGNMTSGPIPNAPTVLATFTWDGENRLLSVTPNGGNTTSYVRDAMGRRVMKSITVSSVTTKTYFFYDGWNLIAEYSHITGTPVLERTHVWGTDLSGSLQGAGGVGGLLATCLNSAGGAPTYYPTYDGNGNVTEYLDGSGVVQAHYEYDPFGNDITPSGTAGSLHNSFPFRFSTKYLDVESGQYHYVFRDYNQWLGRWNNHDPIEEEGGINLYLFNKNDPSKYDVLGLWWVDGGPRETPATIGFVLDGKGGLIIEGNGASESNKATHEKLHIYQLKGGMDPRKKPSKIRIDSGPVGDWDALPYKQLFRCCKFNKENKPILTNGEPTFAWCYFKRKEGTNKDPEWDLMTQKDKESDLWQSTSIMNAGIAVYANSLGQLADIEIPVHEWEMEQSKNPGNDLKRSYAYYKGNKGNYTDVPQYARFKELHAKEKLKYQNAGVEWKWKNENQVLPDLKGKNKP